MPGSWTGSIVPFLTAISVSQALHHMRQPALHTVNRRDSDLPLRVTNRCEEDIYPAIFTQAGVGPDTSGFHLAPGATRNLTVSADWQGRVWGRTNCTVDQDGNPRSGQGGRTCTTGDCGTFPECQGVAGPPATLAEFTMSSASRQTFYDVSLVDGYNIAMGIIAILEGTNNPNLTDIPPNLTNPVCIGTSSLLAPVGDTSDETFGTNMTYPIPLEQSVSDADVQSWCPFPLLYLPPQKPGDGVYPYPDDKIQRPIFSPCLSACAKWNKAQYCCTGKHNSPDSCKPSLYSTQAKRVCPDAYSYAYDDQSSTFILPQGLGFEVVLCPSGRSSTILKTFGDQMRQIAQVGHVPRDVDDIAQNQTYMAERNEAMLVPSAPAKSLTALVILLVWLCFW